MNPRVKWYELRYDEKASTWTWRVYFTDGRIQAAGPFADQHGAYDALDKLIDEDKPKTASASSIE